MRVKIKNLNHLNDILFYAGFGYAGDNLVCIMNNYTLNKITQNFNETFLFQHKVKSIISPQDFMNKNGVHISIGEWLEDMEVDIKI